MAKSQTAEKRSASKARASRARAREFDLLRSFELAENGDAILPDRPSRLRMLLLSPEHNGRVQTERLLLEQQFGKPRQAVEVEQKTEVHHVIEAPPNETAQEWLQRHAANRAAVEEINDGKAN